MKKILFFWNKLTSTFWFIPVLIIVIAVIAAPLLVYIDSQITLEREGVWAYLLAGSLDSAQSMLTTVAAAMIGVAGTVFSITLVALTLASTQFGPRLIRNFMYDRINQIVLGTYIATFIYCLMVLNVIKDNDNLLFIPSFSILLALVTAGANIILLIVFIHHIATSIQADKVISDISGSLTNNIETLFPEELGEENEDIPDKEEDIEEHAKRFSHHAILEAPNSGYLQYVDNDVLLNKVKGVNGLLILKIKPGDYLVKGDTIGELYSKGKVESSDWKNIKKQFILGQTRNHHQDIEHSINQMVEMAARALSPGVNDPFTAVACVDNLTSTLTHLARVKFPSKYRYDEDEENLRIITKPFTYEVLADAAYTQIRHYARGNPLVLLKLMQSLATVYRFTQRSDDQELLKGHAQMVLSAAKDSLPEPYDYRAVLRESTKVLGEIKFS